MRRDAFVVIRISLSSVGVEHLDDIICRQASRTGTSGRQAARAILKTSTFVASRVPVVRFVVTHSAAGLLFLVTGRPSGEAIIRCSC